MVERAKALGWAAKSVAAALNEEGFQTATGQMYDKGIVGYIVRSRGWDRKRGHQSKRGEA